MPLNQLIVFAGVSLLLIIVPGPSVLFVIGRALAYGRRTAIATVLGNGLGSYVLAIAVALGVGAVVQRSLVLFTVIRFAGAAYLIYLGIQAWRHRRSLQTVLSEGAGRRTSPLRALREGFTVGVSNPKTMVFFAAVLPQFADPKAGHVPAQLLVLGLIFTLIAIVSDSVWGLVAGTVRGWFARSPKRLSVVGGVGGLTMIGLGITVAATGRKD